MNFITDKNVDYYRKFIDDLDRWFDLGVHSTGEAKELRTALVMEMPDVPDTEETLEEFPEDLLAAVDYLLDQVDESNDVPQTVVLAAGRLMQSIRNFKRVDVLDQLGDLYQKLGVVKAELGVIRNEEDEHEVLPTKELHDSRSRLEKEQRELESAIQVLRNKI